MQSKLRSRCDNASTSSIFLSTMEDLNAETTSKAVSSGPSGGSDHRDMNVVEKNQSKGGSNRPPARPSAIGGELVC